MIGIKPRLNSPFRTGLLAAVFSFLIAATAVAQVTPADGEGKPGSVDRRIAPSADQIQPLLIGATVPSVQVVTADGEAVDLKEIVSGQPTILIFYRGGW